MALADSRNAIGAAGDLLRSQLSLTTSAAAVDVGQIDDAAGSGPKLNLFLYQLTIDGQLRNHPLDEGQLPPVWLILHYLLTAFDMSGNSDTVDAHKLLGEGMLALQELNYLRPVGVELADNPEPLKISFDQTDPELVSKIMQGSAVHYRVSAAFQVRPVMIAPGVPPSYSPLVLSVGQPGNEGVTVMPSLGPRLASVEPERFEAGASIVVAGDDLSGAIQWVCLGDACYPVTAARAGELGTEIPVSTTLSPGSYPITVALELPSGRRIVSNAVVGELLPTLDDATPVTPLTDDGTGNLSGDLTLSGTRLGGPDDQIFVAFWRDGAVALTLEATGQPTQDQLFVNVPPEAALPPGSYLIILRVNGSQGPASPEVDWS